MFNVSANPANLATSGAPDGYEWVNPSNAGIMDDSFAYAVASEGIPSQYLIAKGCPLGVLPADAVIVGIRVRIRRYVPAEDFVTVTDDEVKLLDEAGLPTGENKAAVGNWPTAYAWATYGGSSDLWGQVAGFWTLAKLTSDFGVRVRIVGHDFGWYPHGRIDSIEITIYYTGGITMGQSFSGTVKLIPNLVYLNDLDIVDPTVTLNQTWIETWANGSGSGQAQQMWFDERTLLTTATEELDLQALAAGPFGTVNFSKVKGIIIRVTTATAGYRLLIGGAVANQFAGAAQMLQDATDKIKIGAGSQFFMSNFVDGFTVDGTHKDIKIDNPSGGSVTYQIIIWGTGTVS